MAPRRRLEAETFSVEQCWCVRSPASDTPVPLPTALVEGRLAVPLGAFEPWLNKALEGRTRVRSVDRVVGFLAKAYEAMGAIAEAGTSPSSEPDPAVAEPKGRAALGLDSDSDEELLGQSAPPSKRPPCVGAKAPIDWRTVVVEDVELTLRRRKGRGLLVALDGEGLPKMLEHLVSGGDEEPMPPPVRRRRRTAEYGEVELDKGRVRWNERESAWMVRYTTADGRSRQQTKGFHLPSMDPSGAPLSEPTLAHHRRRLLTKARAAWNALDHSGAERYADDHCGRRRPTTAEGSSDSEGDEASHTPTSTT